MGLTQDGEVPDGEALEEEDDDYLPLLDPLFKPGAGRGASCFLDFLPLRRPKGLTPYEGMANHP